MKDWKLQYDEILQQHYYINTKTNVISFDSPNEVKKRSILSKFTMKRKSAGCFQTISNKSNKSSKSSKSLSSDFSRSGSYVSSNSTNVNGNNHTNNNKEQHNEIVYDDEYLLGNTNNFKNFAGTALDDAYSIDSDSQSIITYYSNLNTDYYNEYENHPNYENNSASTVDDYTFDKEKERVELRMQLLKQLEV